MDKVSLDSHTTPNIRTSDIYHNVLRDYPDVLDATQVSEILGVSRKTVYKLLKSNLLSSLRIGREYRIPKVTLMKYMKIFGVLRGKINVKKNS